MTNYTEEQIKNTYKLMAKAGYRPKAPSDGMGNITVPIRELRLEDEAIRYAKDWYAEEDTANYYVGVCHGESRPSVILAIEATRILTGGIGGEAHATKLLKLAIKEMPNGKR